MIDEQGGRPGDDDQVTIELEDGTTMRRVPTDADGQPIRPYDARIEHADLGGPPLVHEIPEIRVLEPYADASTGEITRLLVARQHMRTLRVGAVVEVPGSGRFRITQAKRAPDASHRDRRPNDVLFEVVVEPA